MASETTAAAKPGLELVEWVRASVALGVAAADAGEVTTVAARLAQEDFLTVQEVCAPSGPNAADLAELFPGQHAIQGALVQAIAKRQALEAWLQQHLPHGALITAAACADVLQREDFMSVTDLIGAGLNHTDMAELFPHEPDVVSSLLDALGQSPSCTSGTTAAPAPALPVTSVSEQPSVAIPSMATGSIEAWLRARLPLIDVSACARTFHDEGFMNVDDVLSAGITHADLEELFPEWDVSTLTQLFSMIAEGGFTRKTPTQPQHSKTTPVPDSGRIAVGASNQRSDSQKLALRRPADKNQPKQKRKDHDTRPNHSVGSSDTSLLKRLPSSKLAGRPSVGTKIIVQFADSCYKGKVVSHCRYKAGVFDCYFEADGETWTLDANRHQYCQDNTDTGQGSETAPSKTENADITRSAPRAAQKAPPKRKLPDFDSDDDSLSLKGKPVHKRNQSKASALPKTPAVSKQQRLSPERESLLECASSAPTIYRIIAQNAPLYDGSIDMLIRKLGSQISSQQPPGYDAWDEKSIRTAITEMCHYELQQHKWLLKEPFCFFLTKAERRSLGYKRGILKSGPAGGSTTDSDRDAARRAVRKLTLPSRRTSSVLVDNKITGASLLAVKSTSTVPLALQARRKPSAAKPLTQERDDIVRCLFRSSSPLGLDFTRTDDGDNLQISSVATGSESASMPRVRIGLLLHEIQGRPVNRCRAEQQLKELSELANARPLALAFRAP